MVAPGHSGLNTARPWGELIRPAARVQIAVVTALMVFVYWDVIRRVLVDRWLDDGNWSHGWLIPVLSLYFLALCREDLDRIRPRPGYVGAVVLVLALAGYFTCAWRLGMAYPQALSMVAAIAGVTLLLGGWSVLRVVWFPIVFLLFAIPLPRSMYVEITMPLRRLASTAAAAVMPLFAPGLHTEAQAVVIDYVWPGRSQGTLNVEEACSGMRLMMAFVTLGVAMAYLGNKPLWQRIVVVLACLPIAVLCNTIRVTVTGLLYVYGHETWSQGTAHQLLGIAMLGLAMALFSLVDYVAGHLFVEEDGADRPDASSGTILN